MSLVHDCYQQALDVLHGNTTAQGFKASQDRYNAIWGRDGSIICLGTTVTEDAALIAASTRTLTVLQEHQTPLGQIPNHIGLDTGKVNFYATDATAWWVIALASLWRATQEQAMLIAFWPAVDKAMTWLQYQAIDASGLIHSPPAGDWMDSSLQRWGKVLYTNLLFYKALGCAKVLADEVGAECRDDTVAIRQRINRLFWPRESVQDEWLCGWSFGFYEEVIDPCREHYLHYLSFESYDNRCDVIANCLAILWGVADQEQTNAILRYLTSKNLSRPFPIRVLDPPIFHPDRSWNPKIDLDRPLYWQNRPYAYHNAGVWPWVGGFYVTALVKADQEALAKQELEGLAQANQIGSSGEWEFNEWLHGRTGSPMGATHQSWSASSYVMAYKAVMNGMIP